MDYCSYEVFALHGSNGGGEKKGIAKGKRPDQERSPQGAPPGHEGGCREAKKARTKKDWPIPVLRNEIERSRGPANPSSSKPESTRPLRSNNKAR